jgi:hypothetical protein
MPQLWIEPGGGPEHWKRFNKYTDGRPVRWICNYTDLLSDDDYMALPEKTALLLHRLWLGFALTRGHLQVGAESTPSRFRFVNNVTGMYVTSRQLDLLVEAGFIRLSVTKPSRARYGFVTSRAGATGEGEGKEGVKEQIHSLRDVDVGINGGPPPPSDDDIPFEVFYPPANLEEAV